MDEMNLVNQIKEKDRERLRGYRELLDFYTGKQWPGREKYGEKRLTFNYSSVFIKKLTSYLMAGRHFSVEPEIDTAAGRAAADAARRALEQVHEYNCLEQLDYETETDCAVLGDACYKVIWEPDAGGTLRQDSGSKGRVRVTAPDIQGIHAWWAGDDMSRVWRVASRYSLTREEVERLYLGTASSAVFQAAGEGENGTSSVIEVWTDQDFELYIDGVRLKRKPNPYGFIPFVIFPDRMSQNL